MANVERKNWRRRLKVPKSAIKGEIITIKTMAEHVMEPGVRRDPETGTSTLWGLGRIRSDLPAPR